MIYLNLQIKQQLKTDNQSILRISLNFKQALSLSKNNREKEKIEKKITETGFSKIHYVGSSFKRRIKANEDSDLILSSHWRIGHWRNQRFGGKLLNKKLVWIKPVIVNKYLGNPQKGHIYEI